MEPGRGWWIALLVFSSFPLFLSQSSNTSIESLSSTIRDHASKQLLRRRTGVLYKVSLPHDLSGIRAWVLRLRSGTLWIRGANYSSIYIPPRAIPVPPVRRLVLVYHDLGNRSSSYFNVPGYSLLAPIVGCLAYDASNVSTYGSMRELELLLLGGGISVTFPDVKLPKGIDSPIKCASFGRNGSVHLDDMVSKDVCSAASTGHFTIVVPSVIPGSPPAGELKTESGWGVWVIGSAGGVVGSVLVGLVGLGIFRLVRNKKMKGMESQAEDGEALGTIWVGWSKMPTATMMRTQPVIED